MNKIKVIEINKKLADDNDAKAELIRKNLLEYDCKLINIMGSPGCGKTTFIIDLVKRLSGKRILVVEADVDSVVDAETMIRNGIDSIQIKSGGFCHLDANMVAEAIDDGSMQKYDIIIIENIGNLICTASYDLGADLNIVLLSVPEGDDKPQKYPPIFAFADAVIVTKCDYPDFSFFDLEKVMNHVRMLNVNSHVMSVSAKTGSGMTEVCRYITDYVF